MLAFDTQARENQMERDVIEVCKTIMIGVLFTGGAEWEEATETVDDIISDCLADPKYCELFVRNLRAELTARHGILQ